MDGTRIADALDRLVTLLAGSLNVSAVVPREDATVYRGFSGTITGTTALTVWDAPPGTRWLLKGYALTGIVVTVCAASDDFCCYFADSADSNRVVGPIASFAPDAASGTRVSADGGLPVVVNLGSGRLASVDTSNLVITTNQGISTGVIRFAGVCWGDEVKV